MKKICNKIVSYLEKRGISNAINVFIKNTKNDCNYQFAKIDTNIYAYTYSNAKGDLTIRYSEFDKAYPFYVYYKSKQTSYENELATQSDVISALDLIEKLEWFQLAKE